jgi:hypothetical protein
MMMKKVFSLVLVLALLAALVIPALAVSGYGSVVMDAVQVVFEEMGGPVILACCPKPCDSPGCRPFPSF